MRIHFGTKAFLLSLFVVTLAVGAALAQRPGGGTPPDALGGLKRALADANAAELSSQQEEQLKTLITAFREANKPQGPPAGLEEAHRAYEAAILAGNLSAANTAAASITTAMQANLTARQQALAKFQIDALAVLKANAEQYSALLKRVGTAGIVRLVGSLAGGGGRPGPGGPGGPGGGPGAGPAGFGGSGQRPQGAPFGRPAGPPEFNQ